MGEQKKAAERLEETLARAPGSLKTAVNLAKAKMANHDMDGAAEVLKKAAAESPKSAEHALALGQFYMLARPAEAEAQFRRVLEIDPKRALPLALIGEMQAERGQTDLAEKTFQQLSALPDKEYRPAHANFLFQHGRQQDAIREFEQLWKQDPEDRGARGRLVSAYATTGRMADADRVLSDALRKNPKDVDALEQKASLLLTSGKGREAQDTLGQLLHYRPDSAQGHYLLAEVYRASQSFGLQRHELAEAVRLDTSFLTARLQLARALLALHDSDGSLEVLEKAPDKQKKLPSWMVERNWAVLAKGDATAARKYIDTSLAVQRNRDFLFQDAALKLHEGQMAGARVSLEEILRTRPEDGEVLQTLAVSYTMEKRMPAAVERLRQAAASQPKSVAVNLLLGSWLEQNGDLAGARGAIERARAADPASSPAALALGELDLREKKLDAARQTLTPLFDSVNSAVSAKAHLLAGGVEDVAGNYAAAIGHYRKVLERNPENVVAMQHLALLLADQDNASDEALKWAQKADEIAPTDPQVEDTLGWTLYCRGMYSMSLQHLEAALAPTSRPSHKLHLALAYFKMGEKDKGNQALAAALQQNPNLLKALSPAETAAMSSR
ncbi:MAG: tetratricopeptide repeat protein [Bryobacteraceae bacterium]